MQNILDKMLFVFNFGLLLFAFAIFFFFLFCCCIIFNEFNSIQFDSLLQVCLYDEFFFYYKYIDAFYMCITSSCFFNVYLSIFLKGTTKKNIGIKTKIFYRIQYLNMNRQQTERENKKKSFPCKKLHHLSLALSFSQVTIVQIFHSNCCCCVRCNNLFINNNNNNNEQIRLHRLYRQMRFFLFTTTTTK